jgi:hypothetical protein
MESTSRMRGLLLALALLAAPAAAQHAPDSARARVAVADATPEQALAAVEARLAAYNAHDLEAFVATLGPDVVVYQFPNQPVVAGVDTLRASYGRLFEHRPELRAEVRSRIVQGPFVIDQEVVHGIPGGPREHTVVYFVGASGVIERIWYLTG